MIDGKFHVVFRGQTVKSIELAQVKDNLAKLFKSSPEAIDKLFSGQEVVIRKDLDYAAAMKYQSALRQAGALALIKEVEGAQASNQPSAPKDKISTATSQASNSQPTSQAETVDGEGGLTIAAVGAQIMPAKIYEHRDVDTSSLSLAKAGERLLPAKEPEIHAQPSIEHLKLVD